MKPSRRLVAAAVLAGLAPAQPGVAPASEAAEGSGRDRCAAERSTDRIAALGAGSEVALASGRGLRLLDVRLAEGGADDEQVRRLRSWLATLAGQEVAVRAAGPPDRWNRLPAAIELVGSGGRRLDLAEILVGEGWALVDPGERDALCRPDLLALEERARRGRVGLWRDGRLPLAARDPEAIRAAAGRFAVIEGRVASVGERRERTYLNFGRDFSRDFAVTIPRRLWAAMKREGVSAATLEGRHVRVRGLLEIRRAPTLELVSTEMLEWRHPAPVDR